MRAKWLITAMVCGGLAVGFCLLANAMQFDYFGKNGSGGKLVQDVFGKEWMHYEIAQRVRAVFDVFLLGAVGCVVASLLVKDEKVLALERRLAARGSR
ncbi:MAG TPA: hypothetical protein VHR66_31735 [Gemmataceae bacterium]|nr:hypothetical protein [Gemmataceae bacterium]